MNRFRVLTSVAATAALALGLSAAPAAALPAETSVVDGGLRQMVSYAGNLSWSIDGTGISAGSTGTIDVEKPADSYVIAAYLIAANGFSSVPRPTDITLAGQPVTFTHEAMQGMFHNHFGDVTAIVQPIVDAAPAGILQVAVDEGSAASSIEGTVLVVIFQDPAVELASISLYFGASDPTGDTFTLGFDPLVEAQLSDVRMSVGSAFSYGPGQTSTITLTANDQTLSSIAGHFDDCDAFVPGAADGWTCDNGSLLTVGGVGDDLDNPVEGAEWTVDADDELYSLSPFLSVGDTEIALETLNASADDNIFMAAFYLREVALDGAETAPVAPGAPEQEEPSAPTEETEEPVAAAPELAETGADELQPLAGLASLLLIGGAIALTAAARARRA